MSATLEPPTVSIESDGSHSTPEGVSGRLVTPLEVETATGELVVIPRHAQIHVLANEVGYDEVGLEEMEEAAHLQEEGSKVIIG